MNLRTRDRSAGDVRDIPSRGLALVTVLWVLVLLSLVAASFPNSKIPSRILAWKQGSRATADEPEPFDN